jgi:hypothetical protein
MLRFYLLVVLLILAEPAGLHAEKILCISDYQGGGKRGTLERLLDSVLANEGRIGTLIVAGDYIAADDLLTSIWASFAKRPGIAPPNVLLARGNHDEAPEMALDFVNSVSSDSRTGPIYLPDQKPGQITAFTHNGSLFIVTDPFLSLKRKGYTKRQLDRIEALLSASRYTQAFVVGHMPAFPKFRHIGKSIDHFPFARDRLVRILAQHGAHFVHGHDHYANVMRVDTSLHIGCGTINGDYGSAALIDIHAGGMSVRFYEVGGEDLQAGVQFAYQFTLTDTIEESFTLERVRPDHRRYQPEHLWGSRRMPPTRPRFIEMGLMESNLTYLLDWINYLL